MRVHLSVAALVVYFGYLGRLEAWAWAVCLLSFGLVLGLELFNSALERVCDRVTTRPDRDIGAAKDFAAGGVLIAALAAAAAGLIIFLRPIVLNLLLERLKSGHWLGVGAWLAVCVPFILACKKGQKSSEAGENNKEEGNQTL